MNPGAPASGPRWWERLWALIYDHLVQPFLETHDPLPKVAWGASVGWLVGFTPTIGIQMYIVALIWIVSRYAFGFRFNLTIAISLVWLSNPVTMVPLYYTFMQTGDLVMGLLGQRVQDMTFAVFRDEVAELMREQPETWTGFLLAAGQVLIVEFGWPMVLGSLFYAVPGAVLAYPITYVTVRRYRRYLARLNGISYAEWRQRYEAKE